MSRGLGQGELLPPAPAKRLIVPPGHTAYWGVDPSTVRVAVGTMFDGQRGVSMRPFPGLDAMPRLPEIFYETRSLADELLDAGLLPGMIALERPGAPKSRPVEPSFYYAVGTIAAALQVAVFERTSYRVPVELVVSGTWKAAACGNGSIKKPQKVKGQPPPKPEDYPVLVWARGVGYRGTSWDCADAFGITDWAWRSYALEVR